MLRFPGRVGASSEEEEPITAEDVCAALYREHSPAVYRYLLTRGGNPEDAADLTQQTFIRAFKHLGSYEGRAPIAAWLLRIARNAAIDAHRRRHPTLSWERLPERLQPVTETSIEAETEHNESLARLRLLIGRLPVEKRDLLALRFGAGLPSSEIAHVVGKSEAAVKKQLTRIVRQIREEYGVPEQE